MEYLVLGPVEARLAGDRARLPAGKATLLLARLLLSPGTPVDPYALIEDVWQTDGSEGALRALRVHMSNLRRALPEAAIVTTQSGYRLDLAPGDTLDAAEFAKQIELARAASSPARRAGLYAHALTLWRGAPYGGLGEPAFAFAERARLEELRLAALEERADADLACGKAAPVAEEMAEACREHPLREGLWARRMLALYRSGRQSEALTCFRELRSLLVDELGIEPSSALATLHQDILDHAPHLDPPVAVEPAHTPPPLPAAVSRFFGRERERDDIRSAFERARLVTLVGAGGVGKTRLAFEVARGLTDDVWVAELASVEDPERVAGAIAGAVGADQRASDLVDASIDVLRDSPAVLLIDNCEHVVDEAARIVDSLLRACPAVRVLATSREPLRVPGEARVAVEPLPADGPAIELFLDRAALAAGGRAPREGDDVIASICRRLDGLPLAVELAAARCGTSSPHEIMTQLDEVFDVLRGGPRTAEPRHRTMAAAIEWGYRGLSPDERTAFARLSVFADEFTADAAGALDVTYDALTTLADKSLLRARTLDDQTRFSMLAVIREFGRATLDASDEGTRTRDAHLRWALTVAEGPDGARRRSVRAGPVGAIASHIEDLRAALRYAFDTDAGSAAHLALAIAPYWIVAGDPSEGREVLDRVAAAGTSSASQRARALVALGAIADTRGDFVPARAWYEDARAIAREAGDEAVELQALHGAAGTAFMSADVDEARMLLGDARTIAERRADPNELGGVMANLGTVERIAGNLVAAEELLRGAVTIARETGDTFLFSRAAQNLGSVLADRCRLHEALELLESCRGIAAELGDDHYLGIVLAGIGNVLIDLGRVDEAGDALRQALDLAERVQSPSLRGLCLVDLGVVATLRGDIASAEQFGRMSLAIAEVTDDRQLRISSLEVLADIALTRGDLDAAERHVRLGSSLAEAGHESRHAIDVLAARIEMRRGRTEDARRVLDAASDRTDPTATRAWIHIWGAYAMLGGDDCLPNARRAIETAWELGAEPLTVPALRAVATYAADGGSWETAALLLGCATARRGAMTADGTLVASVRAHIGDERFDTAWQLGAAMDPLQALDEAEAVVASS